MRRRLAAAVVADQDLLGGPIGAGPQTLDAGTEQVEPIARRHDQADQRTRHRQGSLESDHAVRLNEGQGGALPRPVEVAPHRVEAAEARRNAACLPSPLGLERRGREQARQVAHARASEAGGAFEDEVHGDGAGMGAMPQTLARRSARTGPR